MSAESSLAVRRCHHCGRVVRDTVHKRESYWVDYYALFTGDTEPVTISDPRDGSSRTVRHVVRPFEVFTCSECYRQPAVRAERERLFRPEQAAEADA
jgi:hypothetical protein